MTQAEFQELESIAYGDKPFQARISLQEYLKTVKVAKVEEAPKDPATGTTARQARSLSQNSAIHLYLEHLAHELNAGGFDMKKVLKQEVDIEWSKEMTKRYLWHPVQEALFGTTSTADLDKHQVGKVYEHINRLISEKCGVFVPFPSQEFNVRLTAMENLHAEDYPEYEGEVKF